MLNGSADDFPPELQAQVAAALEAEKLSVDKGIDAWKRVVTAAPAEWAPRRELARVYKKAERWKNYVDTLTEGVEKANWPSPEAKLPVVWEMIEIYRDRLKLDVKVIQHFNQILTIAPSNLDALDALAAQYETMKRWPDLISILRKKVSVVADPAEKIALNLRIANLYLEKFANQAEAIKAFEAVLELEPTNPEALAYLRDMYNKRRDWDKLVAITQQEIDRIGDPAERLPRRLEVARLASEKLKKAQVSISLWKAVLADDPGNSEALTELERLYEREKAWGELGAILERQVAVADGSPNGAALLTKLALLYTDKVQDAGKAVTTWQALLAVEPENRRAQDALKKLYVQQKDWNALETFYAGQNKYDEFVRVLERQADTEDDATKVGLWLKIAELYLERLGKADRAQKAYERALALDPQNLTAARALVPLYEKSGDAGHLAAALKVELANTSDPDERLARMQQITELLETQAKDKAGAAAMALQAFSEAPAAEWPRLTSERLAADAGNWTELASTYEDARGKLRGAALHPVLATLARVYERELLDSETAIARNKEILQLAPSDETAVFALERLYIATERYADLLAIYDKKLALARTADERRDVRFKLASLYEEEIKDQRKAIDVYLAILAETPQESLALKALDRLYAATAQWEKLAQVIERELALSPDDATTSDLRYRLGAVREQHLADVPGAVTAYRAALDADATHENARRALETYLTNPAHQADALAALEPIYEQLNELDRLVEVQRIKLARETKAAERVRLRLRIGALESALGRTEQAYDAYAAAFEEDPTSQTARTALEDLADALDRWESLVGLYGRALERRDLEPALERELLLVSAVAYEEKLGRSDQAVAYFRRARDIQPEDPSALDALERLYTRTERWPDLVDTLRKKADLVADDGSREQIRVRIATIQEEMIGNLDQAIVAWKEVLADNPSSQQALRALDRLLAAKGLYPDLAENLQRQLDLSGSEHEMVALLGRLGAVRQSHLGDVGGAIETYRRLLDIEPGHPETVSALEELLPNPEHELELAEMLEPVYRARNDFANLIRVQEIEVRHASDPRRKISLLQEIATAYEDGADSPERAYEALARALSQDPLELETQRRIERLARVLGKYEDLIGVYNRLVGSVEDPAAKTALYHRIAELAEREVQRDDWAAEAYHRALEVSPKDLDAANALEQIYVRSGDYQRLVEILRRKMDIVDGVPEKKELGLKAAQIYEEVLEQPEQAIEVYRQVLVADDADSSALQSLERLYVKHERWADLKEVYARKADLATDPAEKKQNLAVLGQVYDREVQDPIKAIETYNAILDIDPDDLPALEALDRLYAQTERWPDLLAILERETELASSTAEAISLRFRIGELLQTKLRDYPRATEAYAQVLGTDPTHEQTIAALERMMAAGEEPILAAQVLEPVYESAGDWERVVAVYEVMVRHTTDTPTKLDLLAKIATIQERRLSNPDAAFDAFRRALAADPTNPDTIAHLGRMAEATARWSDLAALYEEQIPHIAETGGQVDMLLRVARLYEEETGEVDKAIASYQRVTELEPERRDGLVALDRLYNKTQRWPELAEVLRKEIRLAATEEEIISFTFRLAQVLELALNDLPGAVASYQDILNADPAHPETRAALERLLVAGKMQVEIAQILEPLYRLGEEWDKLVEIYNLELQRITATDERVSLLRRLADIAENKLFDQVAAFEWWGKAVLEDPSSELALDELLRLARATHQWEAYVDTLMAAAEHAHQSEGNARREVLLRLASSFEHDVHDLGRAEEVLLQVLAEQPTEPTALAALDRIYDAQGTFGELADILRRRIAITDDSRDLVALNLRLGRVLGEVLEDQDGAVAAYLAVLEHESRNREALEALERLYLRAEKWQDLFGVYEKTIDIANSDAELADSYARMATITAQVFDQRDRAVELWRKVLDLRGPDTVALSALADLHEAAGEWRELTDVLEQQLKATEDVTAQIPTYKRLGRIWGEKLHRERNALECWQQVLALDPTDVEALRAIAENYRAAGAWEELSDTLHRLIDLGVMTEGERQPHGEVISRDDLKELYAQLGELEGSTLMRTQEAINAWRKVLEIDPADFRALAALETLFTQEGRWEECVDVLERRAQALATPEEQVDVLMQAASIWADKIGDGGSAADVYERVLQIDPSNQTASTELEQLYRQRKSWVQLIELLLARSEFVSGPSDRIALLCQIAEVYEQQLNDRDSAFVTLQAAFREDYSNDHVAKELERLATAAGKWHELIGDYTNVVQGIEDHKQAADLWVKIARWYDSALARVDYAIASAKQALSLDAGNTGALAALEDFYRKQSQWSELVSTLAKHAEVEEDQAKRCQLLLQLAATYETQLGDVAQATVAYEQALTADERSHEAIEALERLYRRTQAWDRLVVVLTKKAHIVDDGELAVKLRLTVGELWEERLGDNEHAVEAFKEVLTVDPQNIAALKALERLYERTGNNEALLDILEHQLEVTGSNDERIQLYERIAETWEQQFHKPDRAIDCLQKILLVDDRFEKAYRDLERLYRSERRWEDLVENYRKHINVAADPNERTQLYFKMGRVYEEELKEPDRAIEAYNDVLTFQPEHVETLRGLARLYEQTEQWERAVDIMQRLVSAVSGPEKVDLNYRLGRIYDEQMRMPETAEERLVEALALDATHVPSMLTLLNLYKRRGDSLKAAQLMVRAEQNTQNVLEKSRLLNDAGRIYLRELHDEPRATELFARVIELDPEHVEAAEPLADVYFRQQNWARLVPLLEMLTRKADRKNKELYLLYYKLAKAADQLGDADKALRYYKQAYDLDSTYLPTLLDRAALLYRREQWDDAFKLYQTILVHHREEQRDEDIVEIFYRIGRIKLKTGEKSKAINMFEKALEIAPGHKPTLEALVEIYAAAGDWEAVIRQKRALVAHAADADEKLVAQEQIIKIYRENLKNPQKAIAAYLEALELKPQSFQLLHEVLELFTETKQWKKAVEILTRLASMSSGRIKAKYLEAAGNIANYELNAPDEAVEIYNQALDEDPDNLKVFERIDKILTSKKDWKNQERAYRRMIKRLGTDVPADKRGTQIALWHALGEIYRSRLKDMNAATQAFEVAVSLEPDALPRHQILAELYERLGPESFAKAIGEYRFIVKKTQDLNAVGDYLKVLRRLYTDLNEYDRAWCVTSALTLLNKADPDEQRFHEQYKAKGLARARARLTEDMWRRIYHPDQDLFISGILACISQAVAAGTAKEHKDYGLRRKDRRDIGTDQVLFSRVFNYVSQVLGIAPPEIYLRETVAGDMELANTREKAMLVPSLVVGANLLQGRTDKELAYVIGKKMTFMRPDHFVRWRQVVPSVSALKPAFLAAVKLVQPSLTLKGELEATVTQYAQYLARAVAPQALEQLGVIVPKFLATKAEADLNRWSVAADYTATRAGFLLTNDLEVAVRLAQAEPLEVGSAEGKDKVRDLILWSISDEYFSLRKDLQLTIG